jgi:hypothetical protein
MFQTKMYLMKKLLVILILSPVLSFSKSTIILNIRSCNKGPINSFGTTRILKVLKEGNLIFPLSDSGFYSGYIWIKDLDTGLYRIQYQNLFHKEVCDSIQISENRLYKLDICVDKFNKYNTPFQGLIDTVSELQPLLINTLTYHVNKVESELRIVKINNQVVAHLKQKFKIKGEKRPDVSKSVILSEGMINKIRQFEYELDIVSRIDNVICNGATNYSIQLGQTKKILRDTTCEWDGIYNLIKDLFN